MRWPAFAGLTVAALTLALLVPTTVHSRRLPPLGGEVKVFAADVDRSTIAHALTAGPLVESSSMPLSPAAAAAWPALDGLGRRSRLIASVDATNGGRRWELTAPQAPAPLARSIASCLAPDSAAWPSRALAASGITAAVRSTEDRVEVTLSAPVGDLLTLLQGCSHAAGAFSSDGDHWSANEAALGGRPRLDAVRIVDTPSEADLLLTSGDESGQLLVSEWPDVWLLVPDAASRTNDPWDLGTAEARAAFQRELAPQLILAVSRSGRGAGADAILPPGIAPDRPPGGLTPTDPVTLTLTPLGSSAPRQRLLHDPTDGLAADLADRLALILRARGWAVDSPNGKGPATRIVRWRPPVADAALALIVLSAELGLPIEGTEVPALWSADRATRTAAALTLEQRWMDEGLVTPLLTAARTVFLNPSLQGVRLRGDGAPILGDAWWDRP